MQTYARTHVYRRSHTHTHTLSICITYLVWMGQGYEIKLCTRTHSAQKRLELLIKIHRKQFSNISSDGDKARPHTQNQNINTPRIWHFSQKTKSSHYGVAMTTVDAIRDAQITVNKLWRHQERLIEPTPTVLFEECIGCCGRWQPGGHVKSDLTSSGDCAFLQSRCTHVYTDGTQERVFVPPMHLWTWVVASASVLPLFITCASRGRVPRGFHQVSVIFFSLFKRAWLGLNVLTSHILLYAVWPWVA